MLIFNRLLNRLHSVFNKDPQKVPVISVAYSAGSCLLTVEDTELRAVTSAGTTVIDLSDITIAELVTALDGLTNFTATLIDSDFSDYKARGLYGNEAQDIGVDSKLYYPTSLLWAEMRTHGFALKDVSEDVAIAQDQLYLDKASGIWLDFWGKDFFGILREPGDTDATYLARVVSEAGSLRLNNMALAKLMEALVGFNVEVLDLGHYAQDIFYADFLHSTTDTLEDIVFDDNTMVAIVVSGFGVYFSQDISGLTTDEKNIIKSVIARNKAAGKVAQYFIPDGGGWQEIIL
ncbi:hypothetical protein KAR91_37280 [Candidatus Pacearchaeota archaeon]|nr:hypothetical protein [Candidatus Pacearchaeota archaeon]